MLVEDNSVAHHDQIGGVDHQSEVRHNALREANILHSAFFGHPLPPPSSATDIICKKKKVVVSPKNERQCIGGHRETIFGLSFSHDGRYIATASQDSTICIWEVAKHRLVATLSEGMDVKFECLRVAWMDMDENSINDEEGEQYLLASAGADGIVRLWSASSSIEKGGKDLIWHCAGILDHYELAKNDESDCGSSNVLPEQANEEEEEEEDRPQIYTLQFIQSNARTILMTSTNGCIHLHNVVEDTVSSQTTQNGAIIKRRKLVSYTSHHFFNVNDGNVFGGQRNPTNELYVFDASYCKTSQLLGVALSDGSCRVLSLHHGTNGNEPSCHEQCILRLPPDYFPGGNGGHLTALSWDQTGTRLATCIGSGRVVLWSLQIANENGVNVLHASCISVLEGGELLTFVITLLLPFSVPT